MLRRYSCRRTRWAVLLAAICVACGNLLRSAGDDAKRADAAAWGSDHVGQPLPDYVTGDECLFCHRGLTSWVTNRHRLSIREAQPDAAAMRALKNSPIGGLADEPTLVLGRKQRVRFLKPTGEYGKLALLSAAWSPPQSGHAARLDRIEDPVWDTRTFADACAGCHVTGVDPKTRAFSSASLDCYVCHGDANLDHSKDMSLMRLSRTRNDAPRVVISICGSCHLRSGKSRSTGRPYPNNFVAGDNLFRDFRVDWSAADDPLLNPGDRHIYQNARDVIERGKTGVTCLDCHAVHAQSSAAHRGQPESDLCSNCHAANGPKSDRKSYEVHSAVCDY